MSLSLHGNDGFLIMSYLIPRLSLSWNTDMSWDKNHVSTCEGLKTSKQTRERPRFNNQIGMRYTKGRLDDAQSIHFHSSAKATVSG